MKIKVQMLSPEAILPQYHSEGAACFDLHAMNDNGGVVDAGKSVTFDTGLGFEIPPGFAMLIYSRSGHGFKQGVRLSNCVGVIDSDYRGGVSVKLHNDSAMPFIVQRGDRIAQAKIVPVEQVEFQVVSRLSETARGAGGFGSTGK